MKNIGFSAKLIFVASAMILCFVPDSFGRDGLKLFSVGNNSAWHLGSTWSLSINGASSGFVPQSDDTIVIDRAVIQNVSFTFSDNGLLEVSNTGLLRGDNVNLYFSGNSGLQCSGEIKISNLSVSDNAAFIVENSGKISVRNSFDNNSSFNHTVSGKLSVTGNLFVGASVNIQASGAIESAHYDGVGSISGISPASSIPDGSLVTEKNWIGTSSNNWNDPSNWSGCEVPDITSNIAVLSSLHNPEITDNAFSNNLVINSGSALTVYPEARIDINGNLSVIGIGKLLLKNTVAQKSSLFLSGIATGNIQSEYQVLKGQKNLVSSPVEMAYSKTFLNMYLRTYDESSSQWGDYIVPTNDPLQVMQGYELYSLSSETRTFEGTPGLDPKSFEISNSGNGLNLTGNPFPCYIDWENNENNAWQRDAVASAIYYPDPSGSGNFSVYLPGGDDAVSLNNGSRYIAPMQGFFVKAETKGSLVVTKNSRVSNINEATYGTKNNSIKFKLSDTEGSTDEVLFRVLDNSTYGFDEKFDALKLQNSTGAPSLYLESDGDTRYAVNTIPSVSSSINIPLNMECAKAGQFSISNVGGVNFEYRYPVILEDKELGKFIDLRVETVYSFYHSSDMNSERFEIHFYSPTAVDEQVVDVTGVTVYPGEVIISGSQNETYTATIFSVDGKLISTSKGILSDGLNLSTASQPAGICILQLSNGKQTITKKIFTK